MSTIRLPNHKDMGVAEDQFSRPIGTWRLACVHRHQHSAQYRFVLFLPSCARAAYRAAGPQAKPFSLGDTSTMVTAGEVDDLFPHAQGAEAISSCLAKYRSRRSLHTAEDCMELGKALVLLKQGCAHGEFMPHLEQLGIGYRNANRFMAVVAKFSKFSTSGLFNVTNSQGKLLALLVLDDDEVVQLAEGGTVRGMVAEDIARMSVRQLRARLRDGLAGKESLLSVEKKHIPSENTDGQRLKSAQSFLQALVGEVKEKVPTGMTCEKLEAMTIEELQAATQMKTERLTLPEQMLLLCYRNCTKEGQALVAQTAKVLAQQTA